MIAIKIFTLVFSVFLLAASLFLLMCVEGTPFASLKPGDIVSVDYDWKNPFGYKSNICMLVTEVKRGKFGIVYFRYHWCDQDGRIKFEGVTKEDTYKLFYKKVGHIETL